MTANLRLLPASHLRRPQDFARVYDGGIRAGDGHLLVFVANNDLGYSRFGLSVSRKHGSAVVRNKKRRRLREAFRLHQHSLPSGFDFVLIPRQRDDSTLLDFERSLKGITRRLAGKFNSSSENGATPLD